MAVCAAHPPASAADDQFDPPAADPSTPAGQQARFEQGYAVLRDGRLQEAIFIFEDILRAEPTNQQARLELAYLHIRVGEYQKALRALEDGVQADPESKRLRMDLGYLRLALGQRDAAADEFTLAAREPNEFQTQAAAALAQLASTATVQAPSARQNIRLDEGYAALRRGDKPAARDSFQLALLEDPRRTDIYKQLGYMSIAANDQATAAREFEGARKLAPRDYATALQLGYLYDSLHNAEKAEWSFRQAVKSRDERIHKAAADALAALELAKQRLYLDLYAAPYYTTRFSDTIVYAQAQLGFKPALDWPVSFYWGARYTRDSRSHLGSQPELFADNAAMTGPGVRLQPRGFTASLSAEVNAAFNILHTEDHSDNAEFDRRLVLADYHYWRASWVFADAGGAIGWYSRYRNNVIGNLQARAGFVVFDDGRTVLALYAPVNVLKDGNRDFFNNAFEAGAGLELQPLIRENFKIRAERLRGTYMGIEGRDPNPYGPHYDDFRLTLIFSKRIGLHK